MATTQPSEFPLASFVKGSLSVVNRHCVMSLEENALLEHLGKRYLWNISSVVRSWCTKLEKQSSATKLLKDSYIGLKCWVMVGKKSQQSDWKYSHSKQVPRNFNLSPEHILWWGSRAQDRVLRCWNADPLDWKTILQCLAGSSHTDRGEDFTQWCSRGLLPCPSPLFFFF